MLITEHEEKKLKRTTEENENKLGAAVINVVCRRRNTRSLDFTELNSSALEKPQAAQAHASRKRGIYKLFMALEPGRGPVLGYKRPLTI